MKKVTVRLPDKMHEVLREHAREQNRSLANLMVHYARIETNKRQYHIPPIPQLQEEERTALEQPIDIMDEVYGRR